MPVRLLFQDESRFGRISDQRRCWAPLPSRPVVGHQVIREYVYVMTAVSPKDGRLSSLVMPWLDSEVMSIFLSLLSNFLFDIEKEQKAFLVTFSCVSQRSHN